MKEKKKDGKPKESRYARKVRARRHFLARGGSIEEWREGRRNRTIRI